MGPPGIPQVHSVASTLECSETGQMSTLNKLKGDLCPRMKINSLLISQPTLFNTLTILSCWLGVAGWKAGLNVNIVVDPETVSPLNFLQMEI